MHLTNSAINKVNNEYMINNKNRAYGKVSGLKAYLSENDDSSKRLYTTVLKQLNKTYGIERVQEL
jgi:hypothetical protein